VRHGPLSFVTPKTTVVAFVSSVPSVRRYEIDLLRQLRSRDQMLEIIALTRGRDADVASLADRSVELGDLGPMSDGHAAPLYVVFSQLLALFSSVERGLSPDRPDKRGLISRVVQGVTIYPA
jgi:tagatose-6-phosphate ketose/aldose isomerase